MTERIYPETQPILQDMKIVHNGKDDDAYDLSSIILRHFLYLTLLFHGKQRDYGPGNISQGINSFGDASVLIRMNDKMQRLIKLTKDGGDPVNESIEDSLNDIAVYAMILRMTREGSWPGVQA